MNSDLYNAAHQLMRLFRQCHRQYLEQHNLFVGQPKILSTLNQHPGLSQQELTTLTQGGKETVSMSVRRLMKNGLIKREIDPVDKRKYSLFLTDKGKEVLETVEKGIKKLNDYLLSGFNEEEISQLTFFIQRIIENMEDHQCDEYLSFLKEAHQP